jgi:hypothetical protein
MTPAKGLAALAAAFTAGLTLTLVVIDSSGQTSSQRIETAAPSGSESTEDEPTIVALADAADRSLLRVAGADGDLTDGPEGDVATATEAAAPATITVGAAATADRPPGRASGTGPTGDTATATAAPATGAGANGAGKTEPGKTGAGAGASGGTTAPSSRAGTPGGSDDAAPATTQAPITTAPPSSTRPPTTAAPTPQAPAPRGTGEFEAIRNRDPLFERYANVPSSQLPIDALTISASPKDNGAHPDGNFRMACNYSHFSYDDPIVFPGQPGKSHLHMFFGNTRVDAHTTTDSLVNSGGGSCNGFELNRSGYWTPAVLDGKGNIVVPDQIILYYKTKHPEQTVAMPQGLKMIAGNPTSESFTAGQRLGWSCGDSGTSYNKSNRIPNNCGNDPVNAYIQFPFCWDGRNLDSSNHMSHMAFVSDNESCPSSHPVRLPQITILMYFPAGNTSGWYLSSDRSNGFNTGPGATLHADWFGGWNENAMNLWIDGCIRASRNCSYGQTGTSRMFAKLNNLQTYQGNNFLPMS